jgi:hypothetical protein
MPPQRSPAPGPRLDPDALARPLRSMFTALHEQEAADNLLGGPSAGLRDIARLLDRSAETHWLGYQHALVHAQTERAELLEQRARRYEELAELCRAYAWKPKVADALPTSTAEERAEVGRILGQLIADRGPDELAERARHHDNRKRGPRYAPAALEREAETVRAAAPGVRNETLSRSAWSLARLVCDGLISGGDVLDALIPAARAAGLSSREAHMCVRAALRRRCAA